MRRASLLIAVLVLAACHDARACGRGWRGRHACCHAVTVVPASYPYAQTASSYQPVASAPPAYEAPAAPGEVQPRYSYEGGMDGRPAYYYTYDDSGKLIIQQWGDWLLRGGVLSGTPRPPLPIIGRLRQ